MEYDKIKNEREKGLFINAWERAFSRQDNPLVYAWEFGSNNDLYAVFDNEDVVAGYCLLNYKAVFNQEVVDAALCNSVFVRPDYQGKNLFVRLGRYALTRAEEKGTKIVIGIPNKNAVGGHKRVGWTFLGQINFLEKEGKSVSRGKSHPGIILLNSSNIDSFIDKIYQCSLQVSQGRSFSILKDEFYFKWRYIDHPLSSYKVFAFVDNEVLGYVVYKYYEPLKRLHIIDIEAVNEEVFRELLKVYEGLQENITLVNIWESTIYKNYFLDSGFRRSEESNQLIAIYPYRKDPVLLGTQVNLVLGDNDVF
jgi:GNAT superfamily N-acetyltransferase